MEPLVFTVTIAGGGFNRIFEASGDSVVYSINEYVDERPGRFGQRWERKITTKHKVEWESITYE